MSFARETEWIDRKNKIKKFDGRQRLKSNNKGYLNDVNEGIWDAELLKFGGLRNFCPLNGAKNQNLEWKHSKLLIESWIVRIVRAPLKLTC